MDINIILKHMDINIIQNGKISLNYEETLAADYMKNETIDIFIDATALMN